MTATASRVFLTDQPDRDLACLELRHWPRARVEDRIRAAKATGLGQPLPFDRGSGATAAGGGVQRADHGDLIPSGSCHLSLPWVDRTQHRPANSRRAFTWDRPLGFRGQRRVRSTAAAPVPKLMAPAWIS